MEDSKIIVDKKLLIKELNDQIPELNQVRSRQIVCTLVDILNEHLKNEDIICIRSLGTLNVSTKNRPSLYDFRTGTIKKDILVVSTKFELAQPIKKYIRDKYEGLAEESEDE